MKTSIALVVLLFALVATTFAAPAARTVIALKDGTSVSGELIEATPAGVTVRQSPKSQPITKPWSAIKQVGGGLTRESILAQWRAAQPDKLCETCKGDGTTTCAMCSGKGVDPATAKPCDKCDGTGSIGRCRTSRCDAGKIPCPNTCLKPSDFSGPPDKEGKRWKKLVGRGGTGKISDAHIGELMVVEDGRPTPKGKCPRCEGKSVIEDPACHGTGKQPCVTCHSHGVLGDDCKACDDGLAPCATCTGTGLKPAAPQPEPAN